MSILKTRPTQASVTDFIEGLSDSQQQEDSRQLLTLLSGLSGKDAVLWGDSLVGFGTYFYSNTAGKHFSWPMVAFSPRKGKLTLYFMLGFAAHQDQLRQLGQHKLGKSCLYIKRLDDIDLSVLRAMLSQHIEMMKQKYQCE
ncbi:DUF1801 domain-containing protein [Photobacterium sp. WH77]|uniref:DUF1801 domain-containing protein n=1 Tax=Photobacterium TaxID=657 RepID=UPI001EDB83D8|nr:DUF1801 domain-containing protein [Photobacterium arenosum]MCG2836745.1 DUF1801 domain-containing protein [Photobacterium sp. WH77]MCG2844128.1 DUF1801 domain-containing protein [Photobacterium sp. WH80]